MEAECHITDETNTYTAGVNEFNEMTTIDPVRNAINNGNCFDFAYSQSTVVDDGYVDIFVAKDATKGKKYKIKLTMIESSGDFTLCSYKNPTVSSEGTELTVYNLVTSSTNTFPVAIKHTPTVTTAGTQITPSVMILSSGRYGVAARGDEYSRYEDTDNSYLIRVQNVSGSTVDAISVYGRVIIDGDI